ncbi:DMT family transporter [Saccharibacillus alkalitolerans]|uniref:EamA family transporter n=1 Tax=Saccharibacillus alkalitolerans TaxID=2705290 RepID=A0ABX0F7T6_9BACL|nr:EamA family transporter [Saccharibacillus alkalitolerans]NGZ76450.1 EamA family transporter [Saccharibacillus alkalitolerans]
MKERAGETNGGKKRYGEAAGAALSDASTDAVSGRKTATAAEGLRGVSSRRTGLFFVIAGATLWGVGGTVSQKLMHHYGADSAWLVNIRLLVAGPLLLLLQFALKDRGQILGIWRDRRTAPMLLIYSLAGMLAVQYTFLTSIRYGNAAVATLLQYLSPLVALLYVLLRSRQAPTAREMTTAALALAGCFMLLTNGSLSSLSVPAPAVVWGVLSAVAAAFYTLAAVPLLRKYDSLVVVGWAMTVGGLALSAIRPPWNSPWPALDAEGYGYLAFVLIFGTTLAFWFYIESLRGLPPQETIVLGSLEPLAAVLTTVVWLHEPFGLWQWGGTACIIAVVLLMSLGGNRRQQGSGRV